MTSTIKVNNVQNQCGQNIINENSNTITLGASGDTIALASGASQTGFGRTGTVDWITTPKTSDFTAVSGEGYFVNSAGGAVIVTLPSSPSANSIVSVADYVGSAETNSITIARNGSNINGDASDYLINKSDSAVTFVFVDATAGWTSVNTSNIEDNQNPFIAATGGTETTSGNFKIHTFTGPGTFTVNSAGTSAGSNTVDYLVIAGGASGGGGSGGGGGGAGGYRESPGTASGCYSVSPRGAAPAVALPVSVQGYTITVGAGGASKVCSPPQGNDGSVSTFSTITSAGGGGGGGEGTKPGRAGGSGGGGAGNSTAGPGGSGNTPSVSPAQGSNGGTGGIQYAGGGGGGATGVGTQSNDPAGAGGAGATSSINGTPTARAGGGGGGTQPPAGNGPGPGTDGGGNGGAYTIIAATNATANTGGGGGGNGFTPATPSGTSGAGGSGIVIIRYKFQ